MFRVITVCVMVILNFPLFAESRTSGLTTVQHIYRATNNNRPYVSFEAGTLPGCYGNGGGYLDTSNEDASGDVFSIILSALMGKKQLRVYYTLNAVEQDYNGWGLCTIKAIALYD